jgi:hypothetical protein
MYPGKTATFTGLSLFTARFLGKFLMREKA